MNESKRNVKATVVLRVSPIVRRLSLCAVLLCAMLGTAGPLAAQTTRLSARLSPDTVVYLEWRGNAFLAGADKTNHMLQFMEDPALAPAWATVASRFEAGTKRKASVPPISWPEFVSLLDNPAVLGVTTIAKSTEPAGPDSDARFGYFMVYDGTGKNALVQRMRLAFAAAGEKGTEASQYKFRGTVVEVQTVGTTGVKKSYFAQEGNYALFSDQKPVIEDLIRRFHSGPSPATAISQIDGFAGIRKFEGNDNAVEFFARIPAVDSWMIPGPNAEQVKDFANNLHLEKVNLLAGGVSFSGEATRFRGAVLGDTSSPGPLDLFGPSKTLFETQDFVNGSSAFTISRTDFAASYQYLMNAIAASLPAKQQAMITMAQGMAQIYLGMPIKDALALFTGEIASVTSYEADGKTDQSLAFAIQKPETILKIMRTLLGSKITATETSGDTTYLDVNYPSRDPKTMAMQNHYYYLAVTPRLIVSAPRKPLLREMVQRGNSPSGVAPAGIFAASEFSQTRALMPANLSGLSGMDFSGIPMDAMVTQLRNQVGHSNQASKPTPVFLDFLQPDVIKRHLHMVVGGSWKEATGVYFDSYVR